MKTYQDDRLRQKVLKIIVLQKQGKHLLAGYRSEFGLPTREMLEAFVTPMRSGEGHDYKVGNIGFLDYDHRSGFYFYTPKSGSKLPKVFKNIVPLQLRDACVDQKNRLIKIVNGDEMIFLRHAPVWCPPSELISEINRELARTNTGIIIWKLNWENEERGDHLFESGVPKLRNGQTMVHVSGYAIDPQLKTLIYGGCFGYKTSIESIRISIQYSQFLTIGLDWKSDIHVSASGKYRYMWLNLPEHSSHHACFIRHNALPKHWATDDQFAYVLVFENEENPEQALKKAFIHRLSEVLELPVLESWQDCLWTHASENDLIQPLETDGDCKAGIRIDLQADWKSLFETLLSQVEILVK